MHFDPGRGVGRPANQRIGGGPLVLDGEEAAGDLGAARRCPAPWLDDDEIAGRSLLRLRR
jgi:hypothetical protein